MNRKVTIGLVVLLLGFTLLGQTHHSSGQNRTFHVRGTVSNPLGGVFPATEVVFESPGMTKKIVADAHGFYDAELPSGLYTMTAQASAEVNPRYRPFEKYRRPVFRVGSSSDPIIIDITLYPKRICDAEVVGAGLSQEQLGELWADACGGEDSFDISSQSSTAFQLYIRFLRRSSAGLRREYGGGRVAAPDIFAPVRVEYNLVSLNAERVIYDPEQQTVDAKGNVVVTDESGKPEKAEHMILHLSNGRAIRLH